jgi:hypothetical protein
MSIVTVDQVKLKAVKAEQADNARKAAYASEADPLFFKSQRGEVTEQVWLDKIEEIKARYPKP